MHNRLDAHATGPLPGGHAAQREEPTKISQGSHRYAIVCQSPLTQWPVVGIAQLVEHLVVVQDVAGSNPVTHPRWVRCELSTKRPPLVGAPSWPCFRAWAAHPDIVFFVDVDRLEQRLTAQPTVRIIGMGVNVTDVGQQVQRVVQVRPRVRIVPVMRSQPVVDGLRRSGPAPL